MCLHATQTAKTVLENVKVKFNDVHGTSKLSMKVDIKARSSKIPVCVNIKVSLLTREHKYSYKRKVRNNM